MNTDTSQLDPSIVALMHGLKTSEGANGDYNALGDEGTAAGIGQWSNQPNGKPTKISQGKIPTNFSSQAQQAGLDPGDFSAENQNKVMYATLEADKKAGLSPEQILSKWNSGDPNAYQNTATSTGNGPVGSYDVSAYVKKAMAAAQTYAQKNNQSSNNGLGTFASGVTPQVSNPQSVTPPANTPQAPTPQSGGLYNDLGHADQALVNFLFPIVGDIGGDINGSNKKSFLQQAGDTALSALPFIPGLGEVGEAAKGADAAVEGGEAVAKSGLLPNILKGAGVGYGAGVASNLSQGQGLGQSFMPNINTLGGAALGGATPAILEGASKLTSKLSGIDPAVENELTKMGTKANPEDIPLMDKYNKAAQAHATNVQTPSVENLAASNLDDAAQRISHNTSEAGAAVGAAKKAAGNIPLSDASKIAQDFSDEVKSRYGLEITSDPEGKITVTPTEGSMRQIDPNDVSRIKAIAQQLNVLGKGASVGQATDVIANLDDDLTRSKGIYGQSISPIDQLFTSTRSDLNDVVRDSAPDLATANDRYSSLKDLQGNVREIAGKKLQRGELLMKRVFSDKSQDSLDLFDKIKQETGIDLTKHAVLAKNAIDNFGSNADKSLLAQLLGRASEGKSGLLGLAGGATKSVARNTFANPTKISRALLEGKGNGLLRSLATKGAIEVGSRAGGLLQ